MSATGIRSSRQRLLALGVLAGLVANAGLSVGCYTAPSGPAPADRVTVPISISRHGQPRISVALGGAKSEVLVTVDTGSNVSALDVSFLAEVGIPVDVDRGGRAIGLGGEVTISKCIVPELQIGGFSLGPLGVSAIDMSAKRSAEVALGDRPTVGVVGMDVLARLGAVIDLKRNHLLISRDALKRPSVRVRGVVGTTDGECIQGIQPRGTPITPIGSAEVIVTDAEGIAHEARTDSAGSFDLGVITLGLLRDESIAASGDGLSAFEFRPSGDVLESCAGEFVVVLCAQ